MANPLLILVTGDPVPEAARLGGDYANMIRVSTGGAWDGPWSQVDLRTGEPLPQPGSLSGVIITGSAAHVQDRDPWLERGLTYLRQLLAAGTPTLGICFGHQMMGEAFGGRVARNPKGREIGTVQLEVLEPSALLSGAEQATASATHLDSVVQLPPGAHTFVRTEKEAHALVQFAERAWGVQFHPEMDRNIVRCYIEARGATLEAEGLSSAALLDALEPGEAGRSVLPNFVRNVVRASV
jgi:GMP synthase (glutamine-hydrolysing)